MSKVAIEGNAAGTGTFTIASPNSNTSRAITLPDAAGAVVLDTATQTLTNKTVQGGTIQSATSQASTSGTSIDFTGIPSWVKRITVMFSGVSTNGSSLLLIRLGDSGGVENSGYVSVSSAIGTGGSTGTTTSTAGFVIQSNSATDARNGHVLITNLTGNTYIASHAFGLNTLPQSGVGGGSKTLSDTLTQVRITTVNGTDTFDAGSINILYE